jgi:hypothetical protein
MTGKSYKATNVRRRNTVTQNDNRWYDNRGACAFGLWLINIAAGLLLERLDANPRLSRHLMSIT